ncbi:MAG: NAD(P)/FAD-dependent oxidoreductase [Blastocatellales bacterium]|nr:NAD(P)/FAD-dependent oxidoreductase [Blastocatellales bacterium]
MSQRFDVAVIGGGHNGLVTAAIAARAGLRVIVLERRHVIGGACVTEEVWPGYRVSTLSYLCSLLQPRIIRELDLVRHGFHIYPKDPTFFTVFPDGRHILFWGDERKTAQEISKFSTRDAAEYVRYETDLAQLSSWVEALLLRTPPNLIRRTLGDLTEFVRLGLRTLKLGDEGLVRLVKVMTQSARDFLDERFESPEIKTTLATDGVIGAQGGPSTPGTAYVLLHHVMGSATGQRGVWGFIRGGMGAISDSIASAATAAGAIIRTNAAVERILTVNGRAVGVVLDSGEEIAARAVVSNADPKRTFLKLLQPGDLETEFREAVEKIRCTGSSVKINLALDALPQFTAYPTRGPGAPHRTTIHVCPSMDYIDRAWEEALQGRPSSSPMLECTIPTVYDDSIAPEGKHIMCIFAQYAPYHLRDGAWDEETKDRFADRCIELLAEYAPNIRNIIVHRQVISPLDMEREYGLTGGNIFHGDLGPDQLFFMRPLAGWARYRTPVKGLYMCGSGTHPGGGVMGAPGYNAAREIVRDLSGSRFGK